MYSLYRAWLSLGPVGPLPPPALPPSTNALNLTTPQLPGAPDVALQVGPSMTHFAAHRNILSAHSGYFKATLATHTGWYHFSCKPIKNKKFWQME